MIDENVYIESEAYEITERDGAFTLTPFTKKVLAEISLKIIINGEELLSLLCLNQLPEELALGFLYNEGIIDSHEDIVSISYNEKMFAVIITLREGLSINLQDNLRSITSGCGKGLTYINPLKSEKFTQVTSNIKIKISHIIDLMKNFSRASEIYTEIGGVHSVMCYLPDRQIINEDIGRHNCIDRITGILLKEGKIDQAKNSFMLTSGRISSEIMTKLIRLQVPIIASRSAPTASALRLAQNYNITMIGYLRSGKGIVYNGAERLDVTL